ncbi:hypothetical protein KQX54_020716 [Cotesia glomerata]|uniref:Uncharacterized protein n=1 Tax=Cotesia glomerata TaxID=32391 RepID=A0AAV7IEE5_COTGL|nr:hypothetical protein KQX54_020716 [Cotesia glomerata]
MGTGGTSSARVELEFAEKTKTSLKTPNEKDPECDTALHIASKDSDLSFTQLMKMYIDKRNVVGVRQVVAVL